MKNNHQSRKRRQLSRLIDELKNHLEESNPTSIVIQRIKLRIKNLLQDLSGFIPKHQIKRILGSFAIFFGFATVSTAQVFTTPIENPFGIVTPLVGLQFAELADLDNDGDLDILSGSYSYFSSDHYYYENIGDNTLPNFAAPLTNPLGIPVMSVISVPSLADLDNDGDLDLLTGEYYGGLNYLENTGTASVPNFDTPVPNPFGLTAVYLAAFPEFVDLDDDGDFDLLVIDAGGNNQYFENTGTASSPAFTTPQENPFGLTGGTYIGGPEFADFDNDGDLDLLIGSYYGNFMYFENTGDAANPAFSGPTLNPFGLTLTYQWAFPAGGDLDDDGDVDLLVGEYYGTFQYFENIEPTTSIDELQIAGSISPNPASEIIRFDFDVPVKNVEFLNLAGQVVLTIKDPGNNIDVSSLETGMYIIKCMHLNDQKSTHKIQKL